MSDETVIRPKFGSEFWSDYFQGFASSLMEAIRKQLREHEGKSIVTLGTIESDDHYHAFLRFLSDDGDVWEIKINRVGDALYLDKK